MSHRPRIIGHSTSIYYKRDFLALFPKQSGNQCNHEKLSLQGRFCLPYFFDYLGCAHGLIIPTSFSYHKAVSKTFRVCLSMLTEKEMLTLYQKIYNFYLFFS